MTKILCVGDIHVSDKPPVMCTDSYTDDIIDMLMWTAEFAQQASVDAVVWAGDVFHHKSPGKNSHALVLKMLRVVEEYRNRGVGLSIVTGNHDVTNDRLESVHEKQPLGVLFAAGAHELIGWHPYLPVYGVPWQQNWVTEPDAACTYAFDNWLHDPWRFERPNGPEDTLIPPYDRSKCLVVTHAPIYPQDEIQRGLPFDVLDPAIVAEHMGNQGSVYYGHIHEYHGQFAVDGVTFCNVGALSRGSLHEYNVERGIFVALWTDGVDEELDLPVVGKVTTLGEPGFIEIPVPHKPADEVFLMDQAKEVKASQVDLDGFLARVGSSQIDMSSVASVISHVRAIDNVDDEIKNRAITLLEEADA